MPNPGQKESSGAGTQTEQTRRSSNDSNVTNPAENASTISLPFDLNHELMIQVAALRNAGSYEGHIDQLKSEWFSSNPGTQKIFDAFKKYWSERKEQPFAFNVLTPDVFDDPRDGLESQRILNQFAGKDDWESIQAEGGHAFTEIRHQLEQIFKKRKAWELVAGDPSEVYRLEQQSSTHSLKMSLASVFYDSGRSRYLIRNDRGGYMALTDARLKRHLKTYGFIDARPKDEKGVPAIDFALTQVERENNIDWSGELAGYRPGPHQTGNGLQILITGQAQLVEPGQSSFKYLDNFFRGILGTDDQVDFFYAWLKMALNQLLKGDLATGPAVALVGPPDCGKTLFKLVLSKILGGRSASAGRYLRGGTEFNAELFRSELWSLDDEISPDRYKDRQNLGQFIKKVVADPIDSIHSKGKDAIPVKVWRRLLICCNDDSNSLAILPPLTGSEGLADKLAILKAHVHELPPTETDAERAEFWGKVDRALPGFIHHIISKPIPENMRSRRWGVKVIQNSEVVETLIEDQPEQILHRLIQAHVAHTKEWSGTCEDLISHLNTIQGPPSQLVSDMRLTSRGVGIHLQTLCAQKPEVYSFKRITSGRFYRIRPANDVL